MQLNVELPDTKCRRIKKDAIDMDVTLNEYALQAFERFLSLSAAQRRVYFGERSQRKILGRQIKLN